MRHTFQTAQWVTYPVERVFAFFANPENLPRLMPEWQKTRIEHSTLVTPANTSAATAPAAGAGSQMTITFRPMPLLPFRMTWEATIVEFEWNHHFCDEQPKGPFAYWRHCHQVSSQKNDGREGTRIVDDLTYELPFGVLGNVAHAIFGRRQIEEIFRYRQQRLLELL